MSRRELMLIAAAGSFVLLAGAFVFQYLGYAPCKLCIWQRWPHGVAIAVGAISVVTGPFLLLALVGAGGAISSAVIGIYHTGVEKKWWDGPASCSGNGNSLEGLSGADLLSLDAPVDIVLCDEVAWAFMGLSMASWNAVFSFLLAGIWIAAMRRA